MELQALELVQAFAELLSLARVDKRAFQRAARDPDHLRPDTDAAFIKSFDRNFIALTEFTQHVFFRHKAFFQNQFGGGRRANAELVFFLTDSESFEVLLDNERGDAAITGFGVRVREQHKDFRFLAVRDPELAAVQDEVVAAIYRTRLQGESVRAGSSFTQRISPDFLGR